MGIPVFEQYVDEFGNISVRVSQDIVVLTRDDADRVKARLDQLNAENEHLRELASGLHRCLVYEGCEGCPMQDDDGWCVRDIRLRELGVEMDDN